MDMKICYSSLLLTVVSLCLSLRLEAVSHTAYLEVLEVKNKNLLPILDCIIKHEQQCVYYTPNLIFNIYSRNLNDSIDEVQIGAIGSILTRLELDEKCFEYAGHLFLVEGYKNSLFINTNRKEQISYYIETNDVVTNYDDDTYSFWIYHYISDRFFFRDMYDTYCKPTRSQYGR